jgi:hypothetical protein
MAKPAKTDPATPAEPVKPNIGPAANKIVPLQKRLGKLRRQEAKRKRQLDKVTANSERTKKEMADLIASVNEWVQHPETRQ